MVKSSKINKPLNYYFLRVFCFDPHSTEHGVQDEIPETNKRKAIKLARFLLGAASNVYRVQVVRVFVDSRGSEYFFDVFDKSNGKFVSLGNGAYLVN